MLKNLILLLALSLSSSLASAADTELQMATDLHTDASQTRSSGAPLMIAFSAKHCHFCKSLEEEFLKPMLKSGDYDDKVVIRRVNLDSEKPLNGFNGQPITPAELAKRYKVWVTPTVIFVDAQGDEISERLVGLSSVDYYGGYLDQGINQARNEIAATRTVSLNR